MNAVNQLLAAAKAIDADWTQHIPEGPENGVGQGIYKIDARHRELWKNLRAAIKEMNS